MMYLYTLSLSCRLKQQNNKRKRAATAYQAFVKLNYHEVANELDLKISNHVVKELASRFKALSDQERQVYRDEAAAMDETPAARKEEEKEKHGKKAKLVDDNDVHS